MWRDKHTQLNKQHFHPTLLQWLHEERGVPAQGSREWTTARHTLITASMASDILGTCAAVFGPSVLSRAGYTLKLSRPYRSRVQAIRRKRAQVHGLSTRDTDPINQFILDHGNRCEPIIRDAIERAAYARDPRDVYMPLKFRVHENGWLGASPDGSMNAPLRLLEIKTLVWRHMEKNVIPHKYWVQMQIQMHVYGARECEYVEARVDFLDGYGEWTTRKGLQHKGVAVLDPRGYVHTCPVTLDYEQWHDETLLPLAASHGHLILYYHLPEMQSIRVVYDADWMTKKALPRLHAAYNEIFPTPPSRETRSGIKRKAGAGDNKDKK